MAQEELVDQEEQVEAGVLGAPEELDLSVPLDLLEEPVDRVAPVAAAGPGVLGALVRQALLDLPAARAEVAELEAAAVRAVLEARAAREALAVLEGLAPQVPPEELEAPGAQAEAGAQAAWVRPVPRAVQVVQAVREGRVAPEALAGPAGLVV